MFDNMVPRSKCFILSKWFSYFNIYKILVSRMSFNFNQNLNNFIFFSISDLNDELLSQLSDEMTWTQWQLIMMQGTVLSNFVANIITYMNSTVLDFSFQFCLVLSSDNLLETSWKDVSNDISLDRVEENWNEKS